MIRFLDKLSDYLIEIGAQLIGSGAVILALLYFNGPISFNTGFYVVVFGFILIIGTIVIGIVGIIISELFITIRDWMKDR